MSRPDSQHVRKIDLSDPNFEPTDEEFATLMRRAFADEREQREAVLKKFLTDVYERMRANATQLKDLASTEVGRNEAP